MNETGVWENLHKVSLQDLQKKEKTDWSRAIVDTFSVRPFFWAFRQDQVPQTWKNGNKHNILSDCQSTPLASKVTTTNRHDVTQTLALVNSVLPIVGKPDRPRFRTEILKGAPPYDSQSFKLELIKRDIIPKITKRYTPNGSGLGVTRWVVERTLSWLHQFRRLRTRYEKRLDIHQAFLTIGCCIICFKKLMNAFCKKLLVKFKLYPQCQLRYFKF